MKTQLSLEVQPFEFPYYVKVSAPSVPGGDPSPFAVKLSEVDARTLGALCDDFRRSVFEKAGKQEPPREGCAQCGKALA